MNLRHMAFVAYSRLTEKEQAVFRRRFGEAVPTCDCADCAGGRTREGWFREVSSRLPEDERADFELFEKALKLLRGSGFFTVATVLERHYGVEGK